MIVGIVVSFFLAGAGAFCAIFPRTVRKYDTRMTRWIKDEDDYVLTCRVFGLVFLVISPAPFLISLFPQY